jgi:hypothetical protein
LLRPFEYRNLHKIGDRKVALGEEFMGEEFMGEEDAVGDRSDVTRNEGWVDHQAEFVPENL